MAPMPRFKRCVLALLLAIPAVGCGAEPAETPAVRPPQAPPRPLPPPSAAPAPDVGQAHELIARSKGLFAAMPGYSMEVSYFQKQGSKSSTGVYAIEGKPPRQMRIEIKRGNNPGTKLRWGGGKSIRVRPGGFLSAIALDLPITDERFKSVRGYFLDQTDLHAMFGYMTDPANRPSILSQGPQGLMLACEGPRLLAGCRRMVVRLTPATLLPESVDFYDEREVVFRMTIRRFHTKKNVSLEI